MGGIWEEVKLVRECLGLVCKNDCRVGKCPCKKCCDGWYEIVEELEENFEWRYL